MATPRPSADGIGTAPSASAASIASRTGAAAYGEPGAAPGGRSRNIPVPRPTARTVAAPSDGTRVENRPSASVRATVYGAPSRSTTTRAPATGPSGAVTCPATSAVSTPWASSAAADSVAVSGPTPYQRVQVSDSPGARVTVGPKPTTIDVSSVNRS